jgi:peptide/nickel transport system substrate-binding protein
VYVDGGRTVHQALRAGLMTAVAFPKLKETYSLFKQAYAVPEEEQIQLGKQIWKIVTEEVFAIGTVGLSPAAMGIRIVNNRMGNVPDRQYNSPDGKTPGISRPATFFFKS